MTTKGIRSFWKNAVNQPDHPAIIEANGRTTRFGELSYSANRVVHAFDAQGLKRGDSIALLGKNDPVFLAITLAVLQSGMRLIPINGNIDPQELVRLLNACNPELLLFDEAFAGTIGVLSKNLHLPANRSYVLVGKHSDFLEFEKITKAQSPLLPRDRCAGEFSFITSGTTGPAKVVIRPIKLQDPDVKATNQSSFLDMLGIASHGEGIYLSTLPLSYSSNLFMAICALHLGHTLLLMDDWSTERFRQLTGKHRVTYTQMLPKMFEDLLLSPELSQWARKPYLKMILHSGTSCPIDLKLRMIDRVGPKLMEFYAGAEGGGTYITSKQWMEKPGSVGLPWPTSLVKICDEQHRELPPETTGSVFLKTMDQSFEYLKDLNRTEAVWRSGFFTLGDRGYVDRDGFLFLEKRPGEKSIF